MFDVVKTKERTKKISPIYQDGQALTLEYRMDRFTGQEQTDFEDELASLAEKDEQGNFKVENSRRQLLTKLASYLKEMLVSADWQDAEGLIPIDEEAMMKRLPFNVLMFAFEKIGENKNAKK